MGGREGEREGNHALRSRLIWTCSAQLEHFAFDMHPPPGAVLPSHHSAFSTVPGARIIATQGRKEDGGYWASKWPSGLVTHLVCLINAHVMKLRRGKKLLGVVIMLKIFATRQSNDFFQSFLIQKLSRHSLM